MCVHTRHCCRIHGCKYGDADCPVYLGFSTQESPCELCQQDPNDEDYKYVELNNIPKVNFEEFKKRREYADGLRLF